MKRIMLLLTLSLFLLSANAWAFEATVAGNVAVEDKITAIAESPESGMLAAVSKAGKSLFLIDVDACQVIKKIALDTEPAVVAFDTKRNRVVVLSKDSLSFIDIKGKNAIKSIPLTNSGSALAVSDDWDMALIATDGGITKFDLTTDSVISTLPLPVRMTGIKVFGDTAIVSGIEEKEGSLIFRVNIHDGTIEKQLKMDFAVIGIDANKTKSLVCAGESSGDISLYDSDLTFLNKLSSCDPAVPCSMAAISYNSLMNSVISVDALNNKITVAELESKAVNTSTVEYKGLGQIVTDSTRNMAMIVNEKGVLIAKLENPVPRIDSLIPQTAKSGSAGFTISIEGDKFVRESQALFNGKNVATYFKSIAELQVDINTEDLLYPGDMPVTVKNPLPGGGLSNMLLFKIYDLAPVIEAVSPEFVAVNASLTLRTSGKNFFNGSIISFNGINVKTRFISSILLEAEVDQNLIAKTGIYPVVIVNPQPDGLTSNPGYLTVVDADDPRLQDKKTDQSNASQGTGSLKGKIVNTELKPLQGVTIKIKNLRAVTDAQGNFLMTNIPAGKNVLLMDGSTAQEMDGHYPTIPITVNIMAGIVNDMPFQPYLHRQKSRNFKQINPAEDTILTDPEVPGFEMRIPKGVKIIGWDGKANVKVSVRTVPTDRLPVKPLPQNSFVRTVHMFYFDKIGGGVPDQPIPVKAANDLGLLPGEKAILWYYDESPIDGEAPNDWAIAGTGTVTPDGKYIVSDPGVGIPKFCCGATAYGGSSASDPPTGPDKCGQAGDPVDLATGYFLHENVDYKVPGIIPVEIKRFYRSGDTGLGGFGRGTYFGYDWWLGVYTDMLLLLKPGNHQYRFSKQPDGTYVNTSDPEYSGAVFFNNGNNTYTLKEKNGWSYKFGTSRLLDEIKDPNGDTLTFLKEIDGNISSIILPDGRRIDLAYQIGGASGRDIITSITGPFGTVTYSYLSGQLKSVQYPDGSSIGYEYDASGRMSKITENGKLIVVNEYDANNRVIKQTHSDGGIYTYNYTIAGGNVTESSMTDPNSAVTTWRFYDDSGAYRNGYIAKKITPDGTTTYNRQAGTNLLLSVTDPLSRQTSYTYYANGLVKTVTDNLGNITSYEYETIYGLPTKITDALGKITTFTYTFDTNNRVTKTEIKDPLLNLTTFNYTSYAMPLNITDPNNNTTAFLYENANRPDQITKIIDPLYNTVSIAYDSVGWNTAITDANNHSTSYERDPAGRVTSITDANGNVTRYSYTAEGMLSLVIDAKGNRLIYEYDDRNRITKITDQLGRAKTFTYYRDAEITPTTGDNLKSITDRKGQTTTFDQYDAMNRLKHVTYQDGSTTEHSYDAAGRVTGINDSISGVITYTYNDFGCTSCSGRGVNRIEREVTPLGMIDYTYDEVGRRLTMTVAGEPVVNYVYDDAGRMTSISREIGGSVRTYPLAYDPGNRRTSLQNPLVLPESYVTTTYGPYDSANHLQKMLMQGPSGLIEQLEYTYDPNGNRESFARLAPQPSVAEVSGATYNEANEMLTFTPTGSSAKNMTYDENGNLATVADACGTTTYTWDARNRLTGITGYDSSCATLSASFKYDALNRRIEKTINGTTTQFVYDRYDIVQEIQGGAKTKYIRTLKIDEPFTRIEFDGTVRHYVKDALGSIIALTDDFGVVTTTYSYDPFGNVTITGEASDNPFQYTGRENDGTGLYYYRARYYSPELQRFISEDPIKLRGGINFHAYVGNNPGNFIDPYGLILDMDSARELAKEALQETQDSGLEGQHNGPADAYRHCLWSCKMTEKLGSLDAWVAGTGHEIEGDLNGQPAAEEHMDLNNNNIGRKCGRNKKDNRSCEDKCKAAVAAGELTTLNPPNEGSGPY